ncbi:MAG: HlyD family efflux transporter periplasmic adaptor subunit [Oligoflexia bacterium]|nr:HlyD family efflux transporter periplasmic adaptor subunit [Oligoflexia bacterium]
MNKKTVYNKNFFNNVKLFFLTCAIVMLLIPSGWGMGDIKLRGFFSKRKFSGFSYIGTVEVVKVDLSSRVSSVISSILVKEGDEVNAGDTLLSMSCEDFKIIEELAKNDFERAAKLIKQGSIPKETFEHAKFKYEDAKLRILWCTIKSPLKGTILNRYREPGELISTGTKVFTLANLDEVYAYVYVEEAIVAKLLLKQKVMVSIPEKNNQEVEGSIIKINEEAEFTPKNVQTKEERTRLVYGIKIGLANGTNGKRVLKPGMTVEVMFPE